MHIVLHTQYYPPEIGAPQTRLHELAVGLARKGIQVTVLTAIPNYPHGRFYTGYSGRPVMEQIDGIRVIRTAIYPTQSAKMFPRLLCYLSFVLSSILVGGWKLGKADYILTESPPLFLGIAGFILSRWKGARWILNISDLWPESVFELGIVSRESLGYKLSSFLEELLYKNAWVVSGQSKTILENIQGRFPNLRVYHLPNGVNTHLFQPGSSISESKNFNVVYAGLHGLAQGLSQVIMAANELPSTENIDFTLVGDGPEKSYLITLAKDLGLHQVRFIDSVPKENMPEILNTADVLIIPLKIQLTGAVPSKLYEAMAMGKPVILIASGEAAKIVIDANCGVVVEPGNIGELASTLMYLNAHPEVARQMGINGRRVAIQNHDRQLIVDGFAKFLIDDMRGTHEI